MSAPKHSVKVSILNEEFTIRSDTTPDQAREVANYLDAAARQVMQGSNVSDVVLNWQRGVAASHVVASGTALGVWTINAVRAKRPKRITPALCSRLRPRSQCSNNMPGSKKV